MHGSHNRRGKDMSQIMSNPGFGECVITRADIGIKIYIPTEDMTVTGLIKKRVATKLDDLSNQNIAGLSEPWNCICKRLSTNGAKNRRNI